MKHIPYSLCATAVCLATNATAEQVFSENVIVDGQLCAGSSCAAGETFGAQSRLKLSATGVGIQFNDTGGTSDNDWRLLANDTNEDSFYLVDDTAGTTPFKIMGDAPDNSLFVDDNGQIGLGTIMPAADLHLKNGAAGNIRLESNDGTTTAYVIEAFSGTFGIFDKRPSAVEPNFPRFQMLSGTPRNALMLLSDEVTVNQAAKDYNFRVRGMGSAPLLFTDASTSNVGVGTETPDAPFELETSESFAFFRISASGAAVNKSVDITFTGGPLGTGELRYNIVDGDAEEMKLNANGDMQIDGTLTTAGSCSVGCDAVFAEDYALKSIEDHQAQMWSAGYLPNVGPTPENGPFNVSDKMGRMLNELEHAHIYIGQMHSNLTDATTQIDQLSDALATEKARNDQLAQTVATLMQRMDVADAARN